jgi:hypothetical protein
MKYRTGFALILALAALPAAAEERHQVGLDASVGSSSSTLGITWHLTERFALRPTFSYAHASSDSQDTITFADGSFATTSTLKTTTLSGGLEAMFYVSRGDALATYVAATYLRSYSSQNSTAPQLASGLGTLPPMLAEEAKSYLDGGTAGSLTTNSNVLGGALGAEYALSKHFSAFAEAGLRYSSGHTDTSGRQFGSPTHQSALSSLTTSVGAIFYFN